MHEVDDGPLDANLANAHAASGRTADARRAAANLEHLPEQSGSLDANIAVIYVGLGDTEQAMRWLEKAYQAQFEPIMLVRPQFDPVRTDPRFQALMGRLGRFAAVRRQISADDRVPQGTGLSAR